MCMMKAKLVKPNHERGVGWKVLKRLNPASNDYRYAYKSPIFWTEWPVGKWQTADPLAHATEGIHVFLDRSDADQYLENLVALGSTNLVVVRMEWEEILAEGFTAIGTHDLPTITVRRARVARVVKS